MVDVDVGLRQQVAHHLDVAALAGRDQRGATEPVRERRIGAGLVDQAQDVEQPLGTGIQERVVEAVVLEVDIRLRVDQRLDRGRLAGDGRRQHGRAPVGIAGIDIGAVSERGTDLRHVARCRCRDESLIHGRASRRRSVGRLDRDSRWRGGRRPGRGRRRRRRVSSGSPRIASSEDRDAASIPVVESDRIVTLADYEPLARQAMEAGRLRLHRRRVVGRADPRRQRRRVDATSAPAAGPRRREHGRPVHAPARPPGRLPGRDGADGGPWPGASGRRGRDRAWGSGRRRPVHDVDDVVVLDRGGRSRRP